jgi:Nucleotidyltransferase domain.
MEKKNYLYNYDFSQHTQLIAVYLFGSRVTDKEHQDADFDIALIVGEDFDFIRNYDLPLVVASNLEGIVGTKVDVVLFNKMDPLFQTEIRAKGKPVYVRNKEKLKKNIFQSKKRV